MGALRRPPKPRSLELQEAARIVVREEEPAELGEEEAEGEGFEVIVTSQIDSFRASMRTVVLIRVILELILRV